MTEVIMSYSAIEAAVNELITPTSTYRRPGKGGKPAAHFTGADIERKISLNEKL